MMLCPRALQAAARRFQPRSLHQCHRGASCATSRAGGGACPSRVDQERLGRASLGDIVVTAGEAVCIGYSQGEMDARRVMLARAAADGWHRTRMTERWDYGAPVLDVDQRGTLHVAYGPDPRGYADRIWFGEFEEEYLRHPRRVAERYGVYYTQSRDGDTWTRTDGRTSGADRRRARRVCERPLDDRRVARHDRMFESDGKIWYHSLRHEFRVQKSTGIGI